MGTLFEVSLRHRFYCNIYFVFISPNITSENATICADFKYRTGNVKGLIPVTRDISMDNSYSLNGRLIAHCYYRPLMFQTYSDIGACKYVRKLRALHLNAWLYGCNYLLRIINSAYVWMCQLQECKKLKNNNS